MAAIDRVGQSRPYVQPAAQPSTRPAAAPAQKPPAIDLSKDSFQPAAPKAPVALSAAAATSTAKANASAAEDPKVDLAERMCTSTQDTLQVLQSPQLNQTQRDELVRRLANDPDRSIFLLGDGTTSSADLAKLGDSVAQAYKDGAIGNPEMLKLADLDQSGMGASRVMQQLLLDPANGQPGGVAESFGRALQQRAAGGQSPNADRDRFAANLAFTYSPELMDRNLTTPKAREDAFKSLVNGLDGAVPDGLKAMNPDVAREYQDRILSNAGRLFVRDGQELIGRMTRDGADASSLSRFFAATSFSPDAQALQYDHRRSLNEAIQDTLKSATNDLMSKMPNASPADREAYARQIGSLAATVAGGAQLTLKNWQSELKNSAEARDQLAGTLSKMLGFLAPEVPFKDTALDAISKAIASGAISDPSKPNTQLAVTIFNQFVSGLRGYEEQHPDQPVVTSFDAGYSAERWLLQDKLEILLADR